MTCQEVNDETERMFGLSYGSSASTVRREQFGLDTPHTL